MACEGGCVQGAGCVIRSPQNKSAVTQYAKNAGERTIESAVATATDAITGKK
jgi:iron only hydrogenase large subunit-like protein